jgi:hypothetical protein
MADTYDKDIMVVEAAYNWAPAEYRTSPAPYPPHEIPHCGITELSHVIFHLFRPISKAQRCWQFDLRRAFAFVKKDSGSRCRKRLRSQRE